MNAISKLLAHAEEAAEHGLITSLSDCDRRDHLLLSSPGFLPSSAGQPAVNGPRRPEIS